MVEPFEMHNIGLDLAHASAEDPVLGSRFGKIAVPGGPVPACRIRRWQAIATPVPGGTLAGADQCRVEQGQLSAARSEPG